MQPQKPTPPAPPTPPNTSPAPAIHTKAAAAAAAKPDSRKLKIALGSAAIMVLACGLTLWAVTRTEEPRLNDDTVSIVKFTTTGAYAKLPFERQAEYMKVLEDRDDNDEIEAAFEAGKLSESEYRSAQLEAWLGQQVKRSEKYMSLPPGPARDRYVRELVDKKDAKKARKAAKGNKPQQPGEAPEVQRDKAQEDIRIAAWPAEARANWEHYKRAYDAEKAAREDAAARAQEKAQQRAAGAPARRGRPVNETPHAAASPAGASDASPRRAVGVLAHRMIHAAAPIAGAAAFCVG